MRYPFSSASDLFRTLRNPKTFLVDINLENSSRVFSPSECFLLRKCCAIFVKPSKKILPSCVNLKKKIIKQSFTVLKILKVNQFGISSLIFLCFRVRTSLSPYQRQDTLLEVKHTKPLSLVELSLVEGTSCLEINITGSV